MKKILTLVLALAMVLAVCATAFAADSYSITIDNAKKGETYNAYKIFDVTYANENENPGTVPEPPAPDDTNKYTAYSYSIVQDSEWWSVVTDGKTADEDGVISAHGLTFTSTTAQVGGKTVYTVMASEHFNAAAFAEVLDGAKDGKTAAGSQTAADDGSITSSTDAPGYYFVDTSLGSLCSLDTTEPSATIREKNTLPSQDKKQAIDSEPSAASGYTDDELDVQVGDTVYYQIEVTDGKGTDTDIIITDTLSDGLTFDTTGDPVVMVSVDGGAETAVAADNYSVTDKTATGFKVTLKADYVKTLTEKDKVYIRFTAVVNEDGATAVQSNTSSLSYSNQTSEDEIVKVTPYKFRLDKTDGTDPLKGAKFELYRKEVSDANKISFTVGTAENGVPVLNVATSETTGAFTVINLSDEGDHSLGAASVIFTGLDKDTYILREIAAPEGYNKAEDTTVADTVMVKVEEDITGAATITIKNHTGTELPSTGGIGTTIFYVVGGLLVIGAAVILIARRKVSE